MSKAVVPLSWGLSDFPGLPDDPQTPLHGTEFKMFFQISRQRIHVLMEDIMTKKIPFYQVKKKQNATLLE
jgi:hypothetical protein